MKIRFAALSVLLPLTLHAQFTPTSVDKNAAVIAPYQVVAAGPHERTWRSVSLDPAGRTNVHSYVELATGLNYFNDVTGTWVESQPAFEITSDGYALASKTQHKVIVAPNLNTSVAIDVMTPDDKRFQSHVLGLSYFDPVSGKSVLIAEVTNSIGLLVAPNQIIYPNAFTDFRADYRVTLTRAGLEADVILREQPPLPEEVGLPSDTTQLQVLTEYLQPPIPLEKAASAAQSTNAVVWVGPNLSDDSLSFGAMAFGRGRAFSEDNAPADSDSEAPVGKAWQKLQGPNSELRDFLIESVNYFSIRPQLLQLPQAAKGQASNNRKSKSYRVATNARELPPAPRSRPAGKTIRVAKADLKRQPGYVLDWVLLGSATNYTLQGDSTYYISGSAIFSGITTIEGGTVVKYTNGAELKITGVLNAQTSAYRPAIFTSKDDETVGDSITGSTGNPSTNYAAAIALHLANNYSDLRHVRIAHAQTAIQYDSYWLDYGTPNRLVHAQLMHCQKGVVPNNTAFSLRNVLMNNVLTNFYNTGNASTGSVEHLTIDQAGVMNGSSSIALNFTNCLLVGVTTYGSYSGSYNSIGSSSDFVTVGGGAHYLANNNWRNTGTTNIHPELLADLKKMTTYPPILYSNVTNSVDTVLSPQAQRDTDTPDLGYHYYPLDYLFGGVTENANLTFNAGTAVGWFRTTAGWYHAGHGINMADGKVLTFDGHVDTPDYWVRLNTVQESPGAQLYGPGGITGWAAYITNAPILQARFTKFAIQATENGANHFRDDWGYLIANLTDCQFSGANQGGYISTYAFTNCLFDREYIWLQEGRADDTWTMRNCLVRGGSLSIARTYSTPVSIRDCAFEGTTISMGDSYTNNSSLSDYAYNGYLQGAQQTIPAGTNNVTVTNFYWQAGPLGNYYLLTNSPLINVGSRNATNAGLYHYTVRVDQTKETNSTVDIGFHYVALTPESVSNTVWVNDAIPSGATPSSDGSDAWTWISSNPTSYSGSSNHISNIYTGEHQHYFTGTTQTLSFQAGDRLFTYVYLDPANVPSTVMLQCLSTDSTWWYHRAFWGADNINFWSGARTYLGPLPPTGGWVRLEVPATAVELDGRTINGMAFTLYGGRASWDYSGYLRPTGIQTPFDTDGDGLPDYFEDRNGNGTYDPGLGETNWQSSENGTTGVPGLQIYTPLE